MAPPLITHIKNAARHLRRDSAWRGIVGINAPDDRPLRITLVRRAIAGERKRCAAGHWTASPSRLIGLKALYLAERLDGLRARRGGAA